MSLKVKENVSETISVCHVGIVICNKKQTTYSLHESRKI